MNQQEDQYSDMMTYQQVSSFLCVPVNTLYTWVHRVRIPHIRLGPRLVRFSRKHMNDWLTARVVNPQDAGGGNPIEFSGNVGES